SILNYGQTFLHLSPNSHLDPLHYFMAPPRQMISLWRSIVQQLAGSHAHIEQSASPLKMALDISYLLSGNIPIVHTNPGGNGLPLGDGITPRRPTGHARLRYRRDLDYTALLDTARSLCKLHVLSIALRYPTQ
ncbi:hypothetical protein TcCL_ESM06061, partial [Trypanosoma cruzi]